MYDSGTNETDQFKDNSWGSGFDQDDDDEDFEPRFTF